MSFDCHLRIFSFIRLNVNMDSLTQIFWNEGLKLAKRNPELSALTGYRKFRTFYGVAPNICSLLWKVMRDKPDGSEPKHLLWCMHFLKSYSKEHVNAAFADVDEKTFRLWTWRFIELLSKLNVVQQILTKIWCIL